MKKLNQKEISKQLAKVKRSKSVMIREEKEEQ
jgi:hypothetical protein